MFRIIESNFCRSDKTTDAMQAWAWHALQCTPGVFNQTTGTRSTINIFSLIVAWIVNCVPVQRHHRSFATSPSTKYIILPNRIKSSHDVTYRSNVVNSIYEAEQPRLFALNARQAFFNRGLSATTIAEWMKYRWRYVTIALIGRSQLRLSPPSPWIRDLRFFDRRSRLFYHGAGEDVRI